MIASRLVLAPVLLPVAMVANAQQPESILDRGTFTIYRDTAVIGNDDFSVQSLSSNGEHVGFTITSAVTFAENGGSFSARVMIRLGLDSLPTDADVEATDATNLRSLTRYAPNRVTTRIIHAAGESARELPGRVRYLAASDSAPSLMAILPGIKDGHLFLHNPVSGIRTGATLRNRGRTFRVFGGERREMLRFELRTNDGTISLWYDPSGRLQIVENSHTGVTAVRTR